MGDQHWRSTRLGNKRQLQGRGLGWDAGLAPDRYIPGRRDCGAKGDKRLECVTNSPDCRNTDCVPCLLLPSFYSHHLRGVFLSFYCLVLLPNGLRMSTPDVGSLAPIRRRGFLIIGIAPAGTERRHNNSLERTGDSAAEARDKRDAGSYICM